MSFLSFALLTTVFVKAIFASGDHDTDLDWRPIFKVSAGAKDQWYYDSTSNLFEWWNDTSKSTYDNMEDDFNAAKSIDPSRKESTNYKSLIINNWFNLRYEQMCFDLVRVSVFKDGREVAYIVFSAFESYNDEDWFDRNQIESTSWYDLPSGHTCDLPLARDYVVDINSGCVFSVKGDINTGANRNFYINRNYGGCPNDDGWLGISTQDRCFDGWNPAELADGQPTIHYSKNNVIGNFANDREHDTADTFVVSINGYGCDDLDVPTNEPTEEPGRRDDDDEEGCLVYINTYFSHDNWHCSSQSDGEINSILNDRCDSAHPGSRSITGNDLLNNGYMNIVGLPDSVPFGFLPSCPACGINGDDLGCSIGGRLYIDSFSSGEEWNNFPQDWNIYTNGNSFSYICIYDNCITPSPTPQPKLDDGCLVYAGRNFLHADPAYVWSCNTHTDDEIDEMLDGFCNDLVPGSRSITGEDIILYGENIVGLVDNVPKAPSSFLPSCPGCGNGGFDFGCSSPGGFTNSRYGVGAFSSFEEWNEYPNSWELLQSANSITIVCVFDICN